MKTAELTGPLLDYWVAKADGCEIVEILRGRCFCNHPYGVGLGFSPTTWWGVGGPICKEARIEQFPCGLGPMDGFWRTGIWQQEGDARVLRHVFFDLNPLVAAMRTKVASVYGDEVPDTPTVSG